MSLADYLSYRSFIDIVYLSAPLQIPLLCSTAAIFLYPAATFRSTSLSLPMRRSPFYAYPSYPFQHPHTFFSPSADNAFLHRPPHRPSPSSSTSASSPAPTPRAVINIPVHDSAPLSPLRPVNPPPVPSPAPPATSPTPPLLDPASAATTIQSQFRGYSVRRHQPLRQLRTIAGARKELEELKLELESPGFAHKVRASDKERLRFSESVMAVILRLDAIEGLIPEVRSQRKEATKMAIKLQDAIDAIMMQQDETSGPKAREGALPDAAPAEETYTLECKQNEECGVNMVQSAMPIPVVDARAHRNQQLTSTFHDGDMARVFSAASSCPTAMMDLDKNIVMPMVDGGFTCSPLLKAEDAGLQVIDCGHVANKFTSPELGSQDVSAKAMDAADHDMCCAHEIYSGSEATCAVEVNGNSGICSGCAEAHGGIVLVDTLLAAKEDEDVSGDNGKLSKHEFRKDDVAGMSHTFMDIGQGDKEKGDVADLSHTFMDGREEDAEKGNAASPGNVASLSHTFMDVGQDDEKGFSCPGTPIAEDKPDHPQYSSNVTKFTPDQLCCAFTTQGDVENQHQGESTLEDSLLEKLTESNYSSQSADAPTLCRHGYNNLKDEEKPHVSTDSAAETSLSSDSMLLRQLSEDCRQLKSLLGKVFAHSKVQSKVLCALGDRLEMLEHQQQLNCQKGPQKTCEKRKLKKGSKRNAKLPKQ
eukprot:c25402_g1_i2 orf=72-2177(+)